MTEEVTPKKPRTLRRTSKLGKGRHLTDVEKAHIAEIYKSGSASIRDIAKKYNKSQSAIANFLRKNNIKKGETAEAVAKAVSDEYQKNIVNDAIQIANRIRETKEDHYKMATGLAKLVWKTIADAKKEGKRLDGAIANEIKSYKSAAEALRIARLERYTILNVKESEEEASHSDIPELVIQELTAEEIQQMNQSQRVQMDDIGDMWDEEVADIPDYDDKIEEGEDEYDDDIDDDDEYEDMEEDDGSLS